MKIDLKKTIAVATLLSLLPMAPLAMAAGKHKAPPQAAIDACKDKKAGDEVEYTTAKGNVVKAVCKEFNGQLVAFILPKTKTAKK